MMIFFNRKLSRPDFFILQIPNEVSIFLNLFLVGIVKITTPNIGMAKDIYIQNPFLDFPEIKDF